MAAKKIPTARILVLAAAAGGLLLLTSRGPAEPDAASPAPAAELDEAALATAMPELRLLRSSAKERIAREAAAGRWTLAEAAALFGALNRLPPEPVKPREVDDSLRIPADTEEGWLCRQVVEYVRVALNHDPRRAAAAVARFEAEFESEFCTNGAVRLPDPTSLCDARALLEDARTERSAARSGD